MYFAVGGADAALFSEQHRAQGCGETGNSNDSPEAHGVSFVYLVYYTVASPLHLS